MNAHLFDPSLAAHFEDFQLPEMLNKLSPGYLENQPRMRMSAAAQSHLRGYTRLIADISSCSALETDVVYQRV